MTLVHSKNLYKLNGWLIFFGYFFVSLIIAYGYNEFIIEDEMYYNSIGDRISSDRIKEMLVKQEQYNWVAYVFVLIKLIIKINFTAICLYAGAVLTNYQLPYKLLFKISLVSESVFIIKAIIIFLLQLFFSDGKSFENLASFNVFSAYVFFRLYSIPSYLGYPLEVINIFEIVYWLMLAAGLRHFLQKPFGRTFLFVLGTYGVGLLCWIIFVVFIIINSSA